jgi:hypothetical protein
MTIASPAQVLTLVFYCLPHAVDAPQRQKHRSNDMPSIEVLIERNARLPKSHIKTIHRAAVDSDTKDDLFHELDVIASALELTSHQGA